MSRRKETLLVIALILGMIFQPINSTMITIALSPMADAFHTTMLSVSWVVTIYLIVNAAAQPIAGKMGDIYGYRKIILLGICLFLIGSVGCALSVDLLWLVVSRGVQALGASMLLPNAIAIMRHIIAPERLGRTLGLFTMVISLGTAAGPLLGSFLINLWDWHAIFWVNVPFLLVGLVSVFFLPDIENQGKSSLDILGSGFLAGGLALIVLMTNGYGIIWNIVLFVGLAVFALLFIRRERSTAEPLVDFKLFKNWTFSIANISALLAGLIMYSMMLATPLILEDAGLSIQHIGSMMVTFSLSFSVFSWLGGRLADWIGKKRTIMFSFIVCAIAMAGYLGMFVIHARWYQLVVLVVAGLGIGIGMTAMQLATLQAVKKEMSGIANGIFSTFRYIGEIAASTMVGLLTASPRLFVIVLVVSLGGIVISTGIDRVNGSDQLKNQVSG